MFSSSSYRVLFQSFSLKILVYYLKIVTEAHANLKKKKTTATLWSIMQPWSSTPLWNVRVFPVWSAGRIMFHLFIIKVHMGCSAVHYYIVHIFPRRSIILWRSGSPLVSLVYVLHQQWSITSTRLAGSNHDNINKAYSFTHLRCTKLEFLSART